MPDSALKQAGGIVKGGSTVNKQPQVPWKDVDSNPAYQNLSLQHQVQAKLQYFNQVVAPNLPEQEHPVRRNEFLNYAGRLEIEREAPRFWREVIGDAVLRTPQRATGMVLGAFAAIPSFALAGPAERALDKERFDAMPLWEQLLVATGAGFVSAGKAIFKEGEWGTRYSDYYKATTGETIEETLPNGLKWTAPTLEFLAEMSFDPVISGGAVADLMRLKIPKHWVGKMPKKVVNDLKQIETLDATAKQEVQRNFLKILEQRKSYMNWWDEQLGKVDLRPRGEPLLTPRERGIDSLTAPRSAKVGSPKREFSEIIEKEVPEISKQIEKSAVLGKLKPGEESARRVMTTRKINEFRASQGWGPAKPLPKEEIAKIRRANTLEKLNAYRKEKGIPLVKARATGGLILGIDEDENGDLTYDIGKGLAGSLAVAGGISFIGKKQRFTETLLSNPAWAKVSGTVGKLPSAFSVSGLLGRINTKFFDRVSKIAEFSPKTYAAARTFASFKDRAGIKFNELKEAFKPVKDDEVIMSDYINAHRLKSRAKAGVKNPDNVTLLEAEQAIKEIEAFYAATGKDVTKLKTAFKDFQKWTHDYILKEALESGVISKEGYEAIKKGNEFYATFEVIDRIPQDIRSFSGVPGEYFTVSGQKVIQKMTGTEKKITDPLEATVKKFTEAQAFFARNRVANTFIDDPVAKEFIRPVASSKKEFGIMKNKGLNPVMEGSWNKNEFDTIGRMKDGRLEKYLTDKDIADAMKQITTHQAPRVIQAYNSIFRAAATTLSPAFLVRNVFRDAILGYVASPVHGALGQGKFVKDWGKGAWEAIKHELGKKSLVDDYIEAGGSFGWAGSEATEAVAKRAAKGQLFAKSPVKKVVGAITSPAKLITKANEIVEMAPRIGIFKRSMDLGFSIEDAALAGRQATIDFNRGGTWLKVANQYIPFLNARVQAKVTLYNALKKDPRGTSAKIMSTVMLPGFAGYAMNRLYFSKEYDDIPEYIRQANFVLVYGTETNEKGKTVPKYLAIPKGDAGTLFNPFEYMLDRKIKDDPKGTKEFLINFLSDVSPVEFARDGKLSGTKLAGSLLPPIAKGVIEDWSNLNYYSGSDIVPHYMGKAKPAELQYKENTPEAYKWLGEKLDISPLRLQNFAGNVLASYGREGLSPSAMMRGLKGAILKTTGGEIEQQAWTVVKDIEQGYLYIRAYADEMVKDGDVKGAVEIMKQWNLGINDQVESFNSRFGKYDLADRGGIVRSYAFSRKKVAAMVRASRKKAIDKRTPLERKLRNKNRR